VEGPRTEPGGCPLAGEARGVKGLDAAKRNKLTALVYKSDRTTFDRW
jgi:hypothetical protein